MAVVRGRGSGTGPTFVAGEAGTPGPVARAPSMAAWAKSELGASMADGARSDCGGFPGRRDEQPPWPVPGGGMEDRSQATGAG
jgi:hypothetical protein